MIMVMVSLDLADLVVTYLAFLGPQKVLLAFAHIAQSLDNRSLRLVVAATTFTAACVGAGCALTAPWLATFFHISTSALDLAAGVLFFIYAVGLVLGVHFDPAESPQGAPGFGDEDADPQHPLTTGFRAMLLPYVVSPLAVTAALQDSLAASDWGDRWAVAGAFVIVVLIDAVFAILFAPLLGRAHENVLEVFSRLLGILLAAVGVQLFIEGLTLLGVVHATH